MRRRALSLALAAVAALPVVGRCTVPTGAVVPAGSPSRLELTIFAAASLREALEQAGAAYEASAPDATLTIATDSSAALRTQIEQGAPADVFLSSDTMNPQRLADDGLTEGDPVAFASNELALIVPAGNPAGIASPADLARNGVQLVAAGDEVPITAYVTDVVARLGGLDGYPRGFTAAYARNVVSREDNVSAVVTKIELGEGDAALVYATEAATADGVDTIPIPEAANVTATYAGVVLAASPEPAGARAFLDWLAGAGGQAVLAEHAFLPPPP